MITEHRTIFGNSNDMKNINSGSVNLVVTSPPYPMIEMWDEVFSTQNDNIMKWLNKADGHQSFNGMHEILERVWKEVDRVLSDGGIVCINIGDATRKLGDLFQMFPNHSRIENWFFNNGYQELPSVLWRKQSNKPNKFMGSGMYPPTAYVTLEHEFILIFRKGKPRAFSNENKTIRHRSAYFWEERNIWFSDIWMNLKGAPQKLNHSDLRKRSGAYPFELPNRLINMYSLQGDMVLDPFSGTGTTTVAAMVNGRNSVGYEIESEFNGVIDSRIHEVPEFANGIIRSRVQNHLDFIQMKNEAGKKYSHSSEIYGFDVVTRQERKILFPIIVNVTNSSNRTLIEYEENEANAKQWYDKNFGTVQSSLF